MFARPNRSYEWRDRVMALYAPLALLAFPAVALVVIFVAFACFFEAAEVQGWHDAFLTSGSSLFTLGFERPAGMGAALIAFTEAAIGLGLLAVLIAYLPTIYSSFSRRETMVTQLSVRAGTPPTAWRMLELAHRAGYLNNLDPVWNEWMQWFSELSETHTSIGALPFFRSPNPNRSWITASGTLLDAAALRLSILNIPFTPEPGLCIRSGFLALREIADFFGFEHDPDPSPGDPISVAREEFIEIYERLAAAGPPGAARSRACLARLRGLAGELRPGAARTVQPGDGAVRALVERPFTAHAACATTAGASAPAAPPAASSAPMRLTPTRCVGLRRNTWSEAFYEGGLALGRGAVAADEPLPTEGLAEGVGRELEEERLGRDLACVRNHRGALLVDEVAHVDRRGDAVLRDAEGLDVGG